LEALFNSAGRITTGTEIDPETQGVMTRVNGFITQLTGTSGLFKTSASSISTQTLRLQQQISDLSRTLTARQKSMEAKFIAMERAQSQFQAQAASLSQAFSSFGK
jgi:flagellar capping protein FliD